MIEIVRGGLTAQVHSPTGALPARGSDTAVVAGSAPGWDDALAKVSRPRTKIDIFAANETIRALGKKVVHAASLHSGGDYLAKISVDAKHVHTSVLHDGKHDGMFKWEFDYEYRYPPDSGVFSMLIAYMLGYSRIVLCGVCLDNGTWYERGQSHFKRLVKLMPDVEIKSLFGWTKEHLEDAGAC